MNQKDKDQLIFNEAKKFLLDTTPEEITSEEIQKYLSIPKPTKETVTIKKIYKGILSSAQNSNMKSSVIGKSIGGFNNLSKITHKFDPIETLNEYSDNHELLLERIKEKLKPKGKVRETSRSIWPQYCKTIISSASFLSQFTNSDDFLDWVDAFYKERNTLAALPMILEAEIHGLGFPLACDFLKDLGYSKFGKPDVHIKQIFAATNLVSKKASDYQTLNAIMRISENVNTDAYEVDKIFWLIGSGKFYMHPEIGNNGKTGKMKKAFIEHMNSNHKLIVSR